MRKLMLAASILTICTTLNAQKNPFKKGDIWSGSYQCSGNKIDLKLSIDEVQGKVVRCRFIFLNGSGEYEMSGKYTNKEFTLFGTNWIKNPNNQYVTLGLHGFYLKSPDRLIGNLLSKLTYSEGNECTGFYLERLKLDFK